MSVNKQSLIKERNINKHLHHKAPLVSYGESDTTRRLYHAAPLVALRPVEMWPTWEVKVDMIMRSRDRSHVEVDMIMIMSTSAWLLTAWRLTRSRSCQPPRVRLRDRRQVEVDCGLCQFLFQPISSRDFSRMYDNTKYANDASVLIHPWNDGTKTDGLWQLLNKRWHWNIVSR